MNKHDWTPIRNAHTFCSPACGAGCRTADYVAAKTLAESLAQKLGSGWKPCIHENMGWFARVKNGLWEIVIKTAHYGRASAGGKVTYDVWLQTTPQIIVHGATIRTLSKTMQAARQEAHRRLDELRKQIAILDKVAGL